MRLAYLGIPRLMLNAWPAHTECLMRAHWVLYKTQQYQFLGNTRSPFEQAPIYFHPLFLVSKPVL